MDEETSVQMDETIWKELPEELLESVIARVPIATFIRFRLVCQKWNSLPFLQRLAPQDLPLIYARVWDHGQGGMYDPLVKKWYYSTHPPPATFYDRDGPACDSGGGLVCYADDYAASFHVGNHLTQTWKVFRWPASPAQWGFALVFVYNPLGAGGYKILWLDWKGRYGVLDYSSSKEKTTITEGRIPANFTQHLALGGLAIGSVAYFRCHYPDGIMSYNVVGGTWEQHLIAYPPNKSRIVSLAEGGGRLLLVGWVDCNQNNNAADAAWIRPCVCVWELDMQIRSWIEVDRMPTSYCSEFRKNDMVVRCLSNRRLLVISFNGLKQKIRERIEEIFAYDVVSREWSKVPECIPPGGSHPQWLWYGTSFFPCPSASP